MYHQFYKDKCLDDACRTYIVNKEFFSSRLRNDNPRYFDPELTKSWSRTLKLIIVTFMVFIYDL